ncbi:MAG TPA: hypothetical protein VK524_33180 [Polyangiaceae bacterium]|nr:hypothetical protein [Polyangiaceae bacterium]
MRWNGAWAACCLGSVLAFLLPACAKSDDKLGSGGTGGSGGSGGTSGSGGSGGEIQIDPLCEQLCGKASTTDCWTCEESEMLACTQGLQGACGAQHRAMAECYLSDAAVITCEDGTVTVGGCEAQYLEIVRCEAPEDSCTSALNGECDEPDPCAPGTDTSDCSAMN